MPMMRNRKAFTLIELLTVISIIGVLSALLVAIVTAARLRVKKAKAQSEVREIGRAWKTYWMVYGKWPSSIAGQNRPMDAMAMRILQGENPQRIVFMEMDPEKNDGFKDPWGNHYYVDFTRTTTPGREYYQATMSFPNLRRYTYEFQ